MDKSNKCVQKFGVINEFKKLYVFTRVVFRIKLKRFKHYGMVQLFLQIILTL